MATVLVLLPEGFEEVEAITPIDLWRRAGWSVTTAALDDMLQVTGRNRITVHADTSLDALPVGGSYDIVFLPGGPGVKHLRSDARVRELVVRQATSGHWLFAICAAPTVLHDAGLLADRRYTAHFSVANELTALRAQERVVVDGHLITSRGAGTALDFALETIRQIDGPEAAEKIALSICA